MNYQEMSVEELTQCVLTTPTYRISMAVKYYRDKGDTSMVDKFSEARNKAKILRLEDKLNKLRG